MELAGFSRMPWGEKVRGVQQVREEKSIAHSASVSQGSSCYKLLRWQQSREPVLWESGPTEINEHDTPAAGL